MRSKRAVGFMFVIAAIPVAAFAQQTAPEAPAEAQTEAEGATAQSTVAAPDTVPAEATSAPASAEAADAGADDERISALEAKVAELEAKQQEAELSAVLAQAESAQEVVQAEPLRIYGFMDFGFDKWFIEDDGVGLLRPTDATTFVFGNLNLYFDANPVERLRALVELRFTLAPNGEEVELGPPIGTSYERVDTTVFDYSSPSSQSELSLGGIFIERAWTEYTFSDLFKVQWGLILTPFGIWNLDHGSPTLISLMLPVFISSQMVPTRLLGVHVHGSAFSGSTEYGYAFHVSNGRTPADFDLSEDKGIGARLFVAHEGDFGRLVLGANGYFGRYVDREKEIIPAVGASFSDDGLFRWVTTVEYTESVAGIDAALDVGDLRLRSEGVLRWVKYKGDLSEQLSSADGTEQYLPSRLEWATYLIGAYRTPWPIEPYLEVELASKSFTLPQWAQPAQATSPNFALLLLSAGVNVELTSVTLLKLQAVWGRTYDSDLTHPGVDLPIIFGRVVTSF